MVRLGWLGRINKQSWQCLRRPEDIVYTSFTCGLSLTESLVYSPAFCTLEKATSVAAATFQLNCGVNFCPQFHHLALIKQTLLTIGKVCQRRSLIRPKFHCELTIFSMAVVVAQAVEQLHSVRASRVRIPGRTWLFFGRMLSIYSRWALGYILRKQVIESATYSSFFFPVSYHLRIVNISIALYQRKKIKSPKRGHERPIFKKNERQLC